MAVATRWPQFDADEQDAVLGVLRSGRINYWNGDEGRAFEREFASFHGVPHAIAVANGTLALELALYAAGIGAGDEVVVTPRSFMASASCVVMRGATPVFADVDPHSGNLSPDTVRPVLSSRTRAVIAVHLAGWPCDLTGLRELADDHGLVLIEDCAQAHGATWHGQTVGSFGDAAAFSFCTDKIMSTGGEGGMLLLKDHDQWQRAWSFKDHGKSWDAVYTRQHPPGFRWLHESFGTNWRLTEMQSAIGRIQLRKLPTWLQSRRANAELLADHLNDIPGLRVPLPPQHAAHAYYKFYAFVETHRLAPGWSRDRIVEEVVARGVPCLHGGCSEIYLERAFANSTCKPDCALPVAQLLGATSLMFLVDHTLTLDDIAATADAVVAVMRDAVDEKKMQ